jgi:hypothetical protein
MVIDNQNNLYKIKSKFFIIGFIFIVLITFSLMSDFFKVYFFDFSGWLYAFLFFTIFIIIITYRSILNYNYILFDDESDKIILRYYPIKIFEKKFKSIEISKISYKGFEEKIYFFKQKHDIILYQKTIKGIAKYPPVSITALDKQQKKDLLFSLKNYSRSDKK